MSRDALEVKRRNLEKALEAMKGCVVACSGGVDSMLLSAFAHHVLKKSCWIIHAQSPAVPGEATTRVQDYAKKMTWQFEIVKTDEFSDERYLSNPVDRCFYCKDHLYRNLSAISHWVSDKTTVSFPVLSGTNCDDLSEYRPGLSAAKNHGVRHPFVEAKIDKSDIRALSRALSLPFSELPASPCLASRLYTGTRVIPERLLAADFAEERLRQGLGVDVVRCRLQEDEMRIEVRATDRARYTEEVIQDLRLALHAAHPIVSKVSLDPVDYAPGRAFGVPR